MAEEKVRFQMRISPDTDRRIKEAMSLANCQSKNEFVEKALLFYCGYLSCDDNTEYLAPLVVSSLQSTVKNSEERIARMQFKLAVEIAIMMHVLAAGMEISEEDLIALRKRCVDDVSRTRGEVKFSDAVRFQKGR